MRRITGFSQGASHAFREARYHPNSLPQQLHNGRFERFLIDKRIDLYHAIYIGRYTMKTVKKLINLPEIYAERLRLAAFETRKSQSQLVREGLDLVFAKVGIGAPTSASAPAQQTGQTAASVGAGIEEGDGEV